MSTGSVSTGSAGWPVGVGIVGAGQAGGQHLDALAGCQEATAVAVCDTDKKRLSEMVASHGPGLAAVSSLDDLLADDRVRLVALATPPGTHAALAVQVLRAGRSLLLEKPPVLTSDDLALVVAEAEARGLVAGVMLQHRFRLPAMTGSPPWSASTVAAVEVVRYRPASHYDRDPWRTDPAASGGALIAHLGVHYLDLACQLLGIPAGITGRVDPRPGTELDQRVSFTAEFGQGARLSFIGTTAVDQRAERLAAYDTGRSLTVQGNSTTYQAGEAREQITARTPELRTKVYTDVAMAMRENRQPRVAGLRSAAGVVRLMEMIGELPGRPA